MTDEGVLEMALRHAREYAALIERIRDEAYAAGLHDRAKPGSVTAPTSLMEQITEAVAAEHGVLPSELRGPSRFAQFIEPRRRVWAELRERGYSLSQIGRFFGRDHTTIMHGIREYQKSQEAQQCQAQ
jgi:chromosomal replication initiation ATPase DnaA